MKRFLLIFVAVLVVYAAGMSYYFLHQEAGVDRALRGGPADPATFMTTDQLEKTQQLSTIHYLSFFISTPVQWGILLLFLLLGLSAWFRSRAEALSRFSFVQLAVYMLLFQLALQLIELPLSYYLYHLNREYGLSNQPLDSWFADMAKGFGLGLATTVPVLWLFYWVMKRSPDRWWLWGWLVSIPLTLFFTFVQPVLLDPVFNRFEPLPDQELKQQILQVAAEAGIPADQVYEVNKSKQTNALNAYVTGIGSSTRIVLWDTTLQKLKPDEILFIMAHEMGHYVRKHVLQGTLYGILESFAGFWLVFRLYRLMHTRWGAAFKLRGPHDLAALPALLLLVSVLGFAVSPIDSAYSRLHERSADQYAITLRHDADAGIRSFQKLAAGSLADVDPPGLVQFFLGSHPTLADRIVYLERFRSR